VVGRIHLLQRSRHRHSPPGSPLPASGGWVGQRDAIQAMFLNSMTPFVTENKPTHVVEKVRPNKQALPSTVKVSVVPLFSIRRFATRKIASESAHSAMRAESGSARGHNKVPRPSFGIGQSHLVARYRPGDQQCVNDHAPSVPSLTSRASNRT